MVASERYPRLKGAVFLVTYGRSGSTLLSRMIRTVPGMCFRGENYNVLAHLYRAYAASYRTVNAMKKNFPLEDSSPWYGADVIDPDKVADSLVECFIEQIIKPETTARWIGFKEIRYYELGDELDEFLDFVRMFFPNVRIVFNTRSWRDVAKSSWYTKKPEVEVRDFIKTMDARFAAYCDRHSDSSISLKYERYVDDLVELKPMFDLLEEEFDLQRCQETADQRLTH